MFRVSDSGKESSFSEYSLNGIMDHKDHKEDFQTVKAAIVVLYVVYYDI